MRGKNKSMQELMDTKIQIEVYIATSKEQCSRIQRKKVTIPSIPSFGS